MVFTCCSYRNLTSPLTIVISVTDVCDVAYLRRPRHLWHAHGLQHGHPVLELARVFRREVGDRCQAGKRSLDELEAEALLEEAVVNLVEEGAAQVDKALRFRALLMYERKKERKNECKEKITQSYNSMAELINGGQRAYRAENGFTVVFSDL